MEQCMMCSARIVRPDVMACLPKGRGMCSTKCYEMWLDWRVLLGFSYRVMGTRFDPERVIFVRPIEDKRGSPMGDDAPVWYFI